MTTLAVEINTLGQEGFKNHFTSVLARSGILYDVNDINIYADTATSKYEVSVPFVWKLNFGVWEYEHRTLLQKKTHLWPDGIWPRAIGSSEQQNNS